MPITPGALALIQRAGEALQKANLQIAHEIAGQSSELVATITSEPFSNKADRALTDLRNVSMVHHELEGLEEKLKASYLSAMKLTAQSSSSIEVIKAISHQKRERQTMTEAAEDAPSRPVTGKAKRGPKPRKAQASKPLSPSAKKVLAKLSTILNTTGMTAVQQSEIATMTAISTASVNVAFKVLVEQGFIVSDGKGSYRLS